MSIIQSMATDEYKWSVGHLTFGWKGEGVTLTPVVYILTPYFYSFSALNAPNTPIAIMTPLIPIEKQTSIRL